MQDAAAIEARSMQIIDGLLGDLPRGKEEKAIIKRMVHATGDPDLAWLADIHPRAVQAACEVFARGGKIIADVQMVVAGIAARAARLGVEVLCAIGEPAVAREAAAQKQTRAMAAMRHLARDMTGGMVVIGNAPSALYELGHLVRAGQAAPAVIVATPVGFVGAADSKDALPALGVPYITVHGTKGGSPAAAAAVNALCRLYLDRQK